MFNLVARFLDVVCPRWRTQLIGIGSDGASSMTGHLQGVVTRFVDASSNTKFYRVWCGLHQLDLVLKAAYMDLWENDVVEIMKKFIQHLRQQYGLIAEMKATCPQLTTRWLVMGKVCKWLLTHRITLFEYINSATKPVTSAPPEWWWVVIAGISALTEIINPVFVKLQAQNLLISVQSALLSTLAADIATTIGIQGPISEDDDITGEFNVAKGRWLVEYSQIVLFLESLGMHPRQTLQTLNDELHRKVLHSIGHLTISILEGIVNIQAERNERNYADDDLPPVLPHEIVKLSTSDFGNTIVDMHLPQLRHSWNERTIAEIEIQHRQLTIAYRQEPALKSALDKYEEVSIKSFDTAWAIVEGRFDILRDFCGGIATVFPNTASVESDFSILGWEKDKHRLSITDLSLEGIMHCKQYDILSEVSLLV